MRQAPSPHLAHQSPACITPYTCQITARSMPYCNCSRVKLSSSLHVVLQSLAHQAIIFFACCTTIACASSHHLLHVSYHDRSHVPCCHDLRLPTYCPSPTCQALVLHISSTTVACISCAIPASHRTFTCLPCTIHLYFSNLSLLLLTQCIACSESSIP